jgi:hypothetical protein
MTRARKQTVDYFPHQCNHGETIFILEQRYGNDGYAFWFKLLELLGKTEGHSLDCKKANTLNYLAAKTLIEKDKAIEILNLLAELDAIDQELWGQEQTIWSDNFIKGLSFAYRNREMSIPDKPVIKCKESGIYGTPDVRNPQSKVKEIKGKETKEKDTPPKPPKKSETLLPDDFGISEAVKTWAAGKGFTRLDDHLDAFREYALSRGKTYVDWDSAFKRAIREDWGKIRQSGGFPALPGQRQQPMNKAEQITEANLKAAREAME